eukprot:scaffold35285_cov69-Phaeocystis_antarctica.AAC.3
MVTAAGARIPHAPRDDNAAPVGAVNVSQEGLLECLRDMLGHLERQDPVGRLELAFGSKVSMAYPMIRPFLHVRHSIVSCVRCRPAQRLCDAFVSPNARTELCDAGVAKELCEFAREAFVQSIDAEPWILSKCAVWVFGCPRLGVFRRHTECPRIGEGLAVAGGSPGSSANVGVSAGGLAVECDQQAGQQARQARPRSRIHAPAREQVRVLVVLGAAASPCVPRLQINTPHPPGALVARGERAPASGAAAAASKAESAR